MLAVYVLVVLCYISVRILAAGSDQIADQIKRNSSCDNICQLLHEERSKSNDWKGDLVEYAKVAMDENRIDILQMLIQDFRLNPAAKIARSPKSYYRSTSLICLAASRNAMDIFELFAQTLKDAGYSLPDDLILSAVNACEVDMDFIKRLIDLGVNMGARDDRGRSVIAIAQLSGNTQLIHLIQEALIAKI